MNGWVSIEGRISALAARRGAEGGSYLWLEAGERHEHVVAELYLPAVDPQALDGALGVAIGTVRTTAGDDSGDVRLAFGRVSDGRGVVSAEGVGLDADIRFSLSHDPPSGGYCSRCGSPLEVGTVEVITPPDGGVIGAPQPHCPRCGEG